MRGWVAFVVALGCAGALAAGVKPTVSELKEARDWARGHTRGSAPADIPFSFVYGGIDSANLLPSWSHRVATARLDRDRTETRSIFTDPKTGLEVELRLVEYRDFPTLEWVVYFRSKGTSDTPILEGIRAVDLSLSRRQGDSEFALHHNVGSLTTAEDFRPIETPLPANAAKQIGSSGGRPLNTDMPYFNLAWDDRGLILALSWLGDWTCDFVRDGGSGLRAAGGQKRAHFRLHPGEEVRSPMVVLQFCQGGDYWRSQNIWRRWMRAHSMPKPGGKPMPTVISSSSPDFYTGEKEEVPMIEGIAKHGLKVDYWWRDAGWYPCGKEWWYTGTWEPDPGLFPNGLKPLTDAAHKAGMKVTLWWEPERVVAGSWLWQQHPDWLIGPPGSQKLLDLANKDAWRWLTGHVDRFITSQGLDMYRQDFNMDPSGYWEYGEPADRQGIREIRHVEALLAYWDELKRRHPDMPFDSCASGGKRNVVEMMRRGLPLSKTDLSGGTTSSQCQLLGLARWLPYYGAGTSLVDGPYVTRSNIAPWVGTNPDTRRDDLDYAAIRKAFDEFHRFAPYMLGDLWPFTPYSLAEDVWMAWQFNLPEKGIGMVQAFRRPLSADPFQTYRLRDLDPKAAYRVTDVDTGHSFTVSGQSLMKDGLRVSLAARPAAAILTYAKE